MVSSPERRDTVRTASVPAGQELVAHGDPAGLDHAGADRQQAVALTVDGLEDPVVAADPARLWAGHHHAAGHRLEEVEHRAPQPLPGAGEPVLTRPVED